VQDGRCVRRMSRWIKPVNDLSMEVNFKDWGASLQV